MKRSIVLAIPHFEPMIGITTAARDAGYHRVWTTESTDRDAIVRAVSLGRSTSTIGVGTGIAYAFTRHPVVAAAAAADAQAATDGRFVLGLGAGTRGLRRRYDVVWEHPAPQFVEYVEVLRALLAGGPIDHTGDHYRVQMAAGLGPTARPMQIYGSGVNKVMLRECASVCDGVAIHSLAAAPGYLESVTTPAIAAGAERGGRAPAVACWYIACVNDDEESARASAKLQLAFYLSTPSYRTVAEFGGWGEVAARIRAVAKEVGYTDWARVAREVPDRVVDDLALAGTPEQVRSRLPGLEKRLAAGGIDELVFQLVGTDSGAETVEAAGRRVVTTCAPQ